MTDKIFLTAIKGHRTPRPPYWFMRQAGRYLPEYREVRAKAPSFLDFCFTPDLAVEVTLQPLRRYHCDAAILFSDILVVPWAMGQRVAFEEGRGPVLDALESPSRIDHLMAGESAERLAPVYETVSRLRKTLPDEVALIGFAGAPWTIATYMIEGGSSRDFVNTKSWAYGDPEGFEALIDRIIDATVAYLVRQIDAGAETLQLFDSWAGVLPDDEFERWVIAPNRAIVSKVREQRPDVPIIGFPRGAGVMYEAFLEVTGCDAVSLDTTVPPAWASAHLQSRAAVQGNLDPQLVVAGGESMLNAARRIVAALSDGPHVFNLGHGFVPATPPENVALLVDYLRGLDGS